MTGKKTMQNTDGKCDMCGKVVKYVASFNDSLFCAQCFGKVVTTFVESRELKIRVAMT
jgi:hypothetical protein